MFDAKPKVRPPEGSRPVTVHNAELAQTGQAKRGHTNEERIQFDLMYAQHRRDPGIVHIVSLLGGIVVLDLFYLNKTGSGHAKSCSTAGPPPFWLATYVVTLIGNDARRGTGRKCDNLPLEAAG